MVHEQVVILEEQVFIQSEYIRYLYKTTVKGMMYTLKLKAMKKKRIGLLATAILTTSLLLTACGGKEEAETQSTEMENETTGVTTSGVDTAATMDTTNMMDTTGTTTMGTTSGTTTTGTTSGATTGTTSGTTSGTTTGR